MDYKKIITATMETMTINGMDRGEFDFGSLEIHAEYFEVNGFGFVFYEDAQSIKKLCDIYTVDEFIGIEFADTVCCGENGKFEIYWNYMTAMPETKDSIKRVYMEELKNDKELENESFTEFLERLTDMGGDLVLIYKEV